MATVAEWNTFLHGHVQQTRQVLRKLLAKKFAFTPTTTVEGHRAYEFDSQVITGRIIAGLACAKSVVSPTGHVPGALLVRVYLLARAAEVLKFRARGKWRFASRSLLNPAT
jgi:hypothetical protein